MTTACPEGRSPFIGLTSHDLSEKVKESDDNEEKERKKRNAGHLGRCAQLFIDR